MLCIHLKIKIKVTLNWNYLHYPLLPLGIVKIHKIFLNCNLFLNCIKNSKMSLQAILVIAIIILDFFVLPYKQVMKAIHSALCWLKVFEYAKKSYLVLLKVV